MEDVFIKLPDGVVINISCIESFGTYFRPNDNKNSVLPFVVSEQVLAIKMKSGDVHIVKNSEFINEIIKRIDMINN